MKIFAVYCPLEFTRKPEWLDDFRAKYDDPYEYHVTLREPSFIEESKVEELKTKISDFIASSPVAHHVISTVFDELIVPRDADGKLWVMINADSPSLNELQKGVNRTVGGLGTYCKSKYAQYERNFHPHITIGRITGDKPDDIPADHRCEANITQIKLVVVDHDYASEANDPENQTEYRL